jgi:hypothetical protein
MTIRPVASRRLDEKFVERASTVLLRGFSGARSRFASSLRCSMGLPLGSQARERPPSLVHPRLSCFGGARATFISLL